MLGPPKIVSRDPCNKTLVPVEQLLKSRLVTGEDKLDKQRIRPFSVHHRSRDMVLTMLYRIFVPQGCRVSAHAPNLIAKCQSKHKTIDIGKKSQRFSDPTGMDGAIRLYIRSGLCYFFPLVMTSFRRACTTRPGRFDVTSILRSAMPRVSTTGIFGV